MHAERCPVCSGTGKVTENNGTAQNENKCHGCNGLGWVQVEDRFYQPHSQHPFPMGEYPTITYTVSPGNWTFFG